MKTIWTILGTLMAASLYAQDNSNSLPAIPPPVSSPAAETAPAAAPAPAPETAPVAPAPKPAKHVRKHSAAPRKPATPEPTVSLTPGPADVNASDLTVRGQAGLKGEVVTHLHKGDTVTVLEQINLSHHAADEPAQWAKIAYPANVHVWLDGKYVDASGVVTAKKLNLRAGPGENFSVVGVVEKGVSVTQIQTKGHWMQIQPPANAYAFVAARYLKQEAVATAPPPPPEMPPVTTQVPPPQNLIVTAPPPPQPPTPTVRIVSHEGVVGSVGSPTAPTDYKLYDLTTKQDINFLYPSSPNIDFSKLVDDKVIVSGEEGIQANWPNTPVMAVQDVQIVETNVIKHFTREDLTIPRQRH
jgi:uncharacterized protein YgiM (DUF1202 family)